MILIILFLSILNYPLIATATDRYVDNASSGCSTPSDTDYIPSTRSCGAGGTELVYNTIGAALGVESSGDTIYVRAGTNYVESINNAVASGPGPGFSSVTTVKGYNGERPTVAPSIYNTSYQACVWSFIGTAHSISIENFTFDAAGCTNSGPVNIKAVVDASGNRPSYIRIKNIHIINTRAASGILADFDNSEIIENYIFNNGDVTATNTNYMGHGIYLHSGSGNLISRNIIQENAGFGMQMYPLATNNEVSYNQFIKNGQNGPYCGCAAIQSSGGSDNIHHNTIDSIKGVGIQIRYGSVTKQNVQVDNNSIYCSVSCSDGVDVSAGTGMKVRNNIILGGFSVKIADTATGTTITTNLTTGTAANIWTDPANDNFTLKSGSTAIDAGTDILYGFNGSKPDAGAFETFSMASASINTVNIDVTIGMNANTPVLPTSSATGWSASCAGTGCGTPVVSVVNVLSGSSSILRLTLTGITGNACAVGQTWTVTYNASTGTVTDSVLSGNTTNQPMFSQSSFSVTNNCSGSSAPSYPSGSLIYYPLDGNATDSSGNANNGTLNGSPTFVSAKHSQGMQTTTGVQQYVAVPYGSGVNPSTQALTICTGIYITPGTEGTVNFIAFGAPVGTNQRLYVAATSGTWRLATQSQNSGTASDLSVIPGWNRICVVSNGTGTITLYRNGVAGTTGSGVRTVTSYTLSGNLQLGSIAGNNSGSAIYDDFLLWTSSQNISSDYSAWEPNPQTGSQFSQAAHRFQGVFLLPNGSVENLSANNANRNVADGGAVAIEFQVNCDNVADCVQTSFSLRYSTDGTTFTSFVPNTPTIDGVYFWGSIPTSSLNNGTASGPLTGSLTHTNGPTVLTADAVPNIDLAQNTSFTVRYIVKFSTGLTGQSRYFKLYDQSGNALSGGYTPSTGAKVTIVPISFGSGF